MELLKELAGIIKDLPETAIWLLALFFFYKMSIVGSIYGVIRYSIKMLHDWLTTPKIRLVNVVEHIDDVTIESARGELIEQVLRIRNRGTPTYTSLYIHQSDVDWLRDAIDAQIEADSKRKQQ